MEPEMISSIIPLPWFCVSLDCIHKYVSWVQVLARWPFKSSDLTLFAKLLEHFFNFFDILYILRSM